MKRFQQTPSSKRYRWCLEIACPKRCGIGSSLRLKRYLTPFGLATEHPESPHYTADGYWRGPIWCVPPPSSLSTDYKEAAKATSRMKSPFASSACAPDPDLRRISMPSPGHRFATKLTRGHRVSSLSSSRGSAKTATFGSLRPERESSERRDITEGETGYPAPLARLALP